MDKGQINHIALVLYTQAMQLRLVCQKLNVIFVTRDRCNHTTLNDNWKGILSLLRL